MNTPIRLNGVIRALERGETAMLSFARATRDDAVFMSGSKYDGLIVEMEHNPWDPWALRDFMQYLLDPRRIAASGSVAPAVTPIVRIPPNGAERNQTFAKQALDAGVYGVIWPHVATVEQAYNAVAACRFPRRQSAPNFEPKGVRGDGPSAAVRYWGVSQQEYYERADVWPLAPQGEVLVVLMIESTEGLANLDDMLREVPGIGAVLIGEGDLSQELGLPRQYEHPEVLEAVAQVVTTCKARNVPVGHPHVTMGNAQRLVDEGFQLLVTAPVRNFSSLDNARKLAGRS